MSALRAFFRRRGVRHFLRHRGAVIGTALVFGFVALALAAPLVAPHDPLAQDLTARLEPPSAEHWLGTDDFGRDVLSRVIHGARVSLRLGLFAVGIALVLGGLIGLLAGYYGGWFDLIGMRLNAPLDFAIFAVAFNSPLRQRRDQLVTVMVKTQHRFRLGTCACRSQEGRTDY